MGYDLQVHRVCKDKLDFLALNVRTWCPNKGMGM